MTGRYVAVAGLVVGLWLGGTSDVDAKAVGSCDTEAGCRDLARACGKTKGHTYKPAGESSGVCDDGKAAPASAGASLAAPGGTVGKSFCSTKALCDNLETTCRGTYKPLTPNAGECSK
jgi:hypothetical protein